MNQQERHPVAKAGGYHIAATCPGCGAEVGFGSNLFVAVCGHCNSPLRLILPETPPAFFIKPRIPRREQQFAIDRFCKEHGLPLPGQMQSQLVLVPYWKIDGVMLKVRNEIERREIVSEQGEAERVEVVETPRRHVTLNPFSSTIHAASSVPGIPDSIGMRAQYLALVPMGEDRVPQDAAIHGVAMTADQALAKVQKTAASLSNISIADFGRNSNQFFPLEQSLVFFPYAIYESYQHGEARRYIVDLLDSEVTLVNLDLQAAESQPTESGSFSFSESQVSLQFHRCGTCGEDLPTEPSFLYRCKNCGELTRLERAIPAETAVRSVEHDVTKHDVLFPFWAFDSIENTGEQESRRLLIPAFRSVNHEAMFRLSQRASGAHARLAENGEIAEQATLAPVQISAAEALAFAAAGEARFAAAKDCGNMHTLYQGRHTGGYLLFIPFTEEHYFYVDSCLKAITFERSAVRTGPREPEQKIRV